MHTAHGARLTPLRSVWCHGRVHACFATHARSILTRGYSCPLKPQIGQTFFLRGQPPLIVSARLLVARANRAVTVFASFSSLVPPLSIVCAVCSSFAPPHSSVTLIRFTQHPFFIPGQEPSFALSLRSVHFAVEESQHYYPQPSYAISYPILLLKRQFSTSLLLIAHSGTCLSGTSSVCKTAPALPQAADSAALASSGLPAACALAPLADGSRLPFGFAKKALLFVPLLFRLPRSAKAAHLLCFHFALSQPPTTHP